MASSAGRSDVRGGRRVLAVSGGGAARAERRGAGDEPVAEVGAAPAEPVAAASPTLDPVLRHRHPVPDRGVPQAGAGQQPAVAVQVRGSIGGGDPPPADFSSAEGPDESARAALVVEGYSSVTFVCAGMLWTRSSDDAM